MVASAIDERGSERGSRPHIAHRYTQYRVNEWAESPLHKLARNAPNTCGDCTCASTSIFKTCMPKDRSAFVQEPCSNIGHRGNPSFEAHAHGVVRPPQMRRATPAQP
mmetsp:Transcript_14725/g.38050  ORF Transcript_14725/g.38050 Transcript_14725/m.38050 type:complete len:107 (-) Transcript_14725:203-523(-)